MKKFLTLLVAAVITLGTVVPTYAVTPAYKPLSEYGYTGVSDIEVELSDAVKQGVDNAVQEQLKKYSLGIPQITKAEQYSMLRNNVVYVQWNKVDDATGYDIQITKEDGTVDTYQSKYNFILIRDIVNPLSVKVRASDDDGHLSYWSISVDITNKTLFRIK